MRQQWIISQLDCDMRQKVDCIRQVWWPAQWWDWKEAPKHFPKPNMYPKKGHGHWWSAACLIYYSFLNPGKTITSEKYGKQIDEMQPKPSVGQQIGPNSSLQQRPTSRHTTNTSKVEQIGLQRFASFAIFTWPLTNRLPLLQASRQLFAGKMLSQPAGCRKRFPRGHGILNRGFLGYRNKETYFSLAEACSLQWLLFRWTQTCLSRSTTIHDSGSQTTLTFAPTEQKQ